MKKYLSIILLFFAANMFAQTPEVHTYTCNYEVNTGNGARRYISTMTFYCRFTSDKSVCYETNEQGKKKSEIYVGREKGGLPTAYYNYQGQYEYRYIKTENGVLVYEQKCTYYKKGVFSYGQWYFSDPGGYTSYIYFSPDFKKMNRPTGNNCVYSYEKVVPDQQGAPSRIW